MPGQLIINMVPTEPNMGYIDGLVIVMQYPQPDGTVHISINPGVEDFRDNLDNGESRLRQFVQYAETDETIHARLNAADAPEVKFCSGGSHYSVRLMQVGQTEFQGQQFPSCEFYVEHLELSDVQRTGTLTFNVGHENNGWSQDGNGYNFPPVHQLGIFCSSRKTPDGTLHVFVNGPLGHMVHFASDISQIATPTVHVAITWSDNAVKFYLNGQAVEEKQVTSL